VAFLLYLDEDVDVRLAALLRQKGFDVLTTAEAGRASRGLSDDDQLAFATERDRAIFSHNVRDFYQIASVWSSAGREHAGIVVFGVRSIRELSARFQVLLEEHPDGIRNVFIWLPDTRADSRALAC
jgi:hypothetical protein